MISAILFLSGCKKENLSEISDAKTVNFKMKFNDEILEYSVTYSEKNKTVTYGGKDLERRKELAQKYNESVCLVTGENEFQFFKNRNDYFSFIFKNKSNNRITNNTNNQLGSNYNVLTVKMEMFQHVSYGNLLRTDYMYNHSRQPGPNGTWNIFDAAPNLYFTYYVKLNDGTDNYGPSPITYWVPGVKNPWVGSSQNDCYSSFKVTNYNTLLNTDTNPYVTQPTNYANEQIVFFQHIDYGGKAIAWPNTTASNSSIWVPNLKDYYFGSVGFFQTNTSWNDSFSSYQAFMY